MSKLIIVCGLPGSGKTTLAKEISKRLKIACIHKDSIKEQFFESMNLSTLEDSKRVGKPTIDVLFRLAQEQMENGVDIIIEAPFNFPDDYPLFEGWQRKYGVNLYVIICSISKEERNNRFVERLNNGNRHHSHHDIDRLHIEGFDNNQIEFDYADIPGKQIRITTDKPVNVLVEEVVSRIK